MQKKTTPKRPAKQAKASTKKDALASYREQAAIFINLYFSPKTPAFLHDLLSEWYTELETLTQTFWNDRHIAEVALPLMLKKAADMGIDVTALDTGFMSDIASGFNTSVTGYQELDSLSPSQVLQRELEKDAAALARILNSPHVPANVKNSLGDDILQHMDELNEMPEVLAVQWPLAMQKWLSSEEAAEESDGEQ